MSIKPQLAENYKRDKILFPVYVQPKVDGVRGLNLTGTLTGRSMDAFANQTLVDRFSGTKYLGLDGELVAAAWNAPRLCSLTTSMTNTTVKKGGDKLLDNLCWWVFDLVTPETIGLPYTTRYALLAELVKELDDPQVRLMPMQKVHNLDELDTLDSQHLDDGLEGTILRQDVPYKEGRSDKHQQLWRIKTFIDFEIKVTRLVEGETNRNEATTDTLGHTKRSTHAENMVPNGRVGGIYGTLLADVKDPVTKAVLLAKGEEVLLAPGHMTEKERIHYLAHPEEIVGEIAKGKTFPKGVKDKLRFPIFVSLRSPQDMS